MTGPAAAVGVLRVGPAPVAVPLDVLREVLPCPERLDPLPADTRGTGLLGATNLRGAVLPVLDLRPLLGWPEDRHRDQVVAVVARGNRFLGVLCDEVLGVSRPPAEAVQRIDNPAGGLLFTHSFERPGSDTPEDRVEPGSGAIVSLLDIDLLFELPGVPSALANVPDDTDDAPEQAGPVEAGEPAGSVEQVLVRCGEIRLSLDVRHVHALLPSVRLAHSPLAGPLCAGVTSYAGRSVAAIDLLRLLGLGSAVEDATGGLILRFESAREDGREGFVALLFSEVTELLRVDDDSLMPLPALLSGTADWFRGIVSTDSVGDFLVLDPDRFAGDPTLAALAALNVDEDVQRVPAPRAAQRDDAAGQTRGTPGVGTRYLTYAAAGERATPLLQISEIIGVPESPTPIQVGDPSLLGIFTYRGSVLPLVCLPTLLGTPPDADPRTDPGSRVLVVATDDGIVGFVVPMLRAIETSTWEEEGDDPGPGSPRSAAEAAAVSRVVRLGSEGEDRNLRTLDLAAVAAALSRRAGRPELPAAATP